LGNKGNYFCGEGRLGRDGFWVKAFPRRDWRLWPLGRFGRDFFWVLLIPLPIGLATKN